MSAVIRIWGRNLDCDELLRLCPVEPSAVWRNGESKFPASQSNGPTFDTSGINVVAGDAEMDAFESQIEESMIFLEEHFADLQALIHVAGVEGAVLSFGLNLRDVFVHGDFIRAELVRLAGQLGLGISLTHYPISEDENDAEPGCQGEPPIRS